MSLLAALTLFLAARHPLDRRGKDYLIAQKGKDVEGIQAVIDSMQAHELRQQLEAGTVQIFDVFQDYLLLGDSRVVGFWTYGFLPPENVLADAGHTILSIEDQLPEIQKRQPGNIIISYGVNDMGLEIGKNEGGYDAVFEPLVRKILEASPKSQIYICSIIPATPQARERTPRWDQTEAFNSKIKAMCERSEWTYIDTASLSRDGTAEIYQEDGIHFLEGFYVQWAFRIYEAMERHEASLRQQKLQSTAGEVGPVQSEEKRKSFNQTEAASANEDSFAFGQGSREEKEGEKKEGDGGQ